MSMRTPPSTRTICIPEDIDNGECSSPNNHSMGSGSFSSLGSVSDFIPSPTRERITTAALTALSKEQKQEPPILPFLGAAVVATTSTPVALSRHLSLIILVSVLFCGIWMLIGRNGGDLCGNSVVPISNFYGQGYRLDVA
jgi:hypothetical protein